MKTKNGTCIDVIAPDNLPPLSMDLDNGITLLSMDHGAFKLRVHTPHKTIVSVQLDDAEVLKTKVRPGIHVFAEDDSERKLEFKPVTITSEQIEDDGKSRSEALLIGVAGVEEEPVPVTKVTPPFVGRGGRLKVSLSYYKEDHGSTVQEVVFLSEEKIFQFNAGDDHNRAVLENFHRFVPTSDGTISQHICGCCRVTR